jgi:hypothetical protein
MSGLMLTLFFGTDAKVSDRDVAATLDTAACSASSGP